MQGQNFLIYGEISEFSKKEWCYIGCPICNKILNKIETEWFCVKDDIIQDPIYR